MQKVLVPNDGIPFRVGSYMKDKLSRLVICLLICCSMLMQQTEAYLNRAKKNAGAEATQMAEILGVRSQLDRVVELQNSNDPGAERERIALKSQILQKALIGFLDVRRASDKNDRELSYSYNLMRREQRKQDLINELFTLANFAQLGTLYTMEPFLRLNNQFQPSAICTQTGSGTGLLLPIASMIQQRTARSRHTAPPPVMHNLIDAGPVDGNNMPGYVEVFFSTPAVTSDKSRKQEMYELWKTRYGVDANNRSALCSLVDGKPKTLRTLNTRILLLWSLHTYILDMDHSLLSLLRAIETAVPGQLDQDAASANLESLGLSKSAIDAARLLKIQNQVAQLVALNKNPDADIFTKQRLETNVLSKILSGALEVREAADQVDAEINYASDVVLSELLAKRGKLLQRNYEANFIQAGTFGSVAGLLYLKHFSKVGNEMFVISGGIGTGLSLLALRLMRGGRRSIDTNANSLADVFNLPIDDEYRFSPLMTTYLNSPAPDTASRASRREVLIQYWQEQKISSVKLTNKKTLEGLAGEPSAKYDTIKIVTNRISMLHSLLAHIESLDPELLDLLHATASQNNVVAVNSTATMPANISLSAGTVEAVRLLGIGPDISQLAAAKNSGTQLAEANVSTRLDLIRKIFTATLDVRTTQDVLDAEIAYEYDALGRMTRRRDLTVAVTNNINFFQLNILATIIDGPLGLSGNPRYVRASNMLNIVSGFAVGGLALLTVVEERGGLRPTPAKPNMVGQCLGLSPPNEYRFSPVMWGFINEPPPDAIAGQTRVQQMVTSWKKTKFVTLNMDKRSNQEKVADYGPHHTKFSETITMLKNRLNMMFDIRGVVGLFDEELDDTLRTVS